MSIQRDFNHHKSQEINQLNTNQSASTYQVSIPAHLRPDGNNNTNNTNNNDNNKTTSLSSNGAKNPFGRPDPTAYIPPQSEEELINAHAASTRKSPQGEDVYYLNTNPYDKDGPPGIATNFIDVNCDCLADVRASRCKLMLESFANCHNTLLKMTMRRNIPPMFQQCEGHYTRMMMCVKANKVKNTALVDNPHQDNVFVRGV